MLRIFVTFDKNVEKFRKKSLSGNSFKHEDMYICCS